MDNKSWFTVDDIMKDLRMPRKTSRRLDRHFIVSGQLPPRNLTGTEETEEQYIGHGAEGDEVLTPDLALIKKMLDIVNEEEKQRIVSNVNNQDGIIEISKVNHIKIVTSQTQSKASGDCLPFDEVIVKPKKKCNKPRHARNVAVSSIMQNMTESERQDIINDNMPIVHSVCPKQKKVKTLQTSQDSMNPKTSLLSLSATNMFRSKKKMCLSPEKQIQDSDSSKSIKSPSSSSSSSSSNAYVPSSYAQEKYKEYMNRNSTKDKEAAVKNYWDDIIQQMKNIEAKRATKDDDIDRSNHPQLTDEQFKHLGPALLPMHRHNLTDDCIVCTVQSERKGQIPKIVTSTPETFSDSMKIEYLQNN